MVNGFIFMEIIDSIVTDYRFHENTSFKELNNIKKKNHLGNSGK